MQTHDLVHIRQMPALAPLAILVATLRNTILALDAFHPNLPVAAWNPEADTLLRLAQAVRANAASLAILVGRYRKAAVDQLRIQPRRACPDA